MWYQKRSFWILLVDALAAIGGILIPLLVGADAWKVVLAVWAALQPLVLYIIKELTIEDAKTAAREIFRREMAAPSMPQG
jgi:hypothetical protein